MIEHSISVIESFLKLRKGDEGRLLYLKNALINGKTIYESDKKYLKKIQLESDQDEIICGFTKISENKSTIDHDEQLNDGKNEIKQLDKIPLISENIHSFDVFESELKNIRTSIKDLKSKDCKIKDNLELLLINREISSQHEINKLNSFSNIPKRSSDLFDLIKTVPVSAKPKSFDIKKHNVLTCISIGFLSIWFAGYQNLINLDSFQDLSLGFSAGAAVSAGLFYIKEKTR